MLRLARVRSLSTRDIVKKQKTKRCLCHYAETGIIRRWQRLHRTSSAAPIPTRPEYSIHSHAMRHLFRRCVPRQGQIVCK